MPNLDIGWELDKIKRLRGEGRAMELRTRQLISGEQMTLL